MTLTRDSTESDLKQRREIVAAADGSAGVSAVFSDQAPVRAALNGRVLILEGIERAERNVLPTLNNLLENREMQLEDGRFLVSPARFVFPSPSLPLPLPLPLPLLLLSLRMMMNTLHFPDPKGMPSCSAREARAPPRS